MSLDAALGIAEAESNKQHKEAKGGVGDGFDMCGSRVGLSSDDDDVRGAREAQIGQLCWKTLGPASPKDGA